MQLNQQKLKLLKKIVNSKLSASELNQATAKAQEIIDRRKTKKE